jgi:hypothetical protein
MSTERLSDEERRNIFADAARLEAARAAIADLSDSASLRICYVELEMLLVRIAANRSRAASGAATAESSQDPIVAIEPSSTEAPTQATPTSTATTMRSIEPAPSPTLATITAIVPTSTGPSSTDPSTAPTITPMQIETAPTSTSIVAIDPTSSDHTSSDLASSDLASSDLASSEQASNDPASTESLSMGDLFAIDLPFAQAKKRLIAAFEREYLCRVMTVAKDITAAAKIAGEDRTNFKRLLARNKLRETSMTAMTPSKRIEHAAKYTDTIVEILANNPQGLRTYEIAERTEQPIGNAHNILKLLLKQSKIARHGHRYNTLWTIAGGTPVPRVETLPQAAIAVATSARGPIDSRKLRDEMSALLTDIGKPPTPQAIRRAIKRLLKSHDLECAGANTNGTMYRLGPKSRDPLLGPKNRGDPLLN